MSADNLFDELEIIHYEESGTFRRVDDPIVRESSIRVFLNGDEIVVLSALKKDLRELALGFLFSEVYIDDISALQSVEVSKGLDAVTVVMEGATLPVAVTNVRSVTTGCGRSVSFINPLQLSHFPDVSSTATVSATWIGRAMDNLTNASQLFRKTGGVHTAALSDGVDLVYLADDIGRHNCVDKVIGWDLLNRTIDPQRRVILSSGRLCTAIVSKAIRGQIPFVISRSAPTIGAVQLARESGITLVGFMRGKRFNIYSHEERIVP